MLKAIQVQDRFYLMAVLKLATHTLKVPMNQIVFPDLITNEILCKYTTKHNFSPLVKTLKALKRRLALLIVALAILAGYLAL